jgi:Antibiotic biosynthesis monooxygenase
MSESDIRERALKEDYPACRYAHAGYGGLREARQSQGGKGHVEDIHRRQHSRCAFARSLDSIANARRPSVGAIGAVLYQRGGHRRGARPDRRLLGGAEREWRRLGTRTGLPRVNITVSPKDPNHVFIFEVYGNAAAFEAHRATDHFKKYAATTKDMVAKRDARALQSVAMNMKGK